MNNLLAVRNSNRLRFINAGRYLSCRFSFSFFSCRAVAASPSSSGDSATQTHAESLDSRSIKQIWGVIGRDYGLYSDSSLNDLLLRVSDVVPDISRRFRRYSGLKSDNVLELLLGFESEYRRTEIGGKKIESLWKIFRWPVEQYKGFKHLRQSCEVMASILIREGMVKEVELLLMEMESSGDSLNNTLIISDLINKYIAAFDSDKAYQLFDRMRRRDLVPSPSCYQLLLDHMIRIQKTESAFRICSDWMETTTESNRIIVHEISRVIELLCLDQRVQEARNLVRKLITLNCELNSSIFDKIALGYCEKQDFDDLLSFIAEVNHTPDVIVGNRIVYVLSRNFGTERANLYMEELEHSGFKPDEITLGILIGWSCYEGNIKRAFHYLSKIVSNGLQPDVYSFNAIMGELFRKGLGEHACHVLDEMIENEVKPNMLTFKIMLAGYCKARLFEKAKTIVHEMLHCGMIEADSVKDPLSEAFSLLGLDPLSVKLRRDNDAGLSKTEFFDDLGNGLYLDTDSDAYEEKMNRVLDRSALPNFNLFVMKACKGGEVGSALELIDEMVRWGQEPSSRVFAVLMKCLCTSRRHVRVSVSLLRKWPKLANRLDEETLNVLVQEYCKKGFTCHGRLIFERMFQMHLRIDNETYTELMNSFCKKGTIQNVLRLLDIARRDRWIPNMETCGHLWERLLREERLKEAFQLFDDSSISYSESEAFKIFFKKLCGLGFSRIAHSLVKRLEERGCNVFEHDVLYSHLMRGFCKDRNVFSAFAVIDEMLDKKLVLGSDDCLMLIPRLCMAHKTRQAISLADLCLKSDPSISCYVYHALIDGFCSTGKITEAENRFRLMLLSNGVNPDSVNSMFRGYCEINGSRKVREVLGALLRKNMIVSIQSYREYVRRMCSENQFVVHAIKLKDFLVREKHHCSLVVYNLLIFHLLRAKRCSLVNEVLCEMTGNELLPDEVTYNFLVHGFSSCGDFSGSLRYLNLMMSEGYRPNNRSLRAVIGSLCDNGGVEKALELSRVMESKGWAHGSFVETKIAETFIENGKVHQAESFLTRVIQIGNNGKAINYDNLIKKLSSLGKLDLAIHLVNIMLKKGNVPDCSSYESIINGFVKCNRLDNAMEFHTEMVERGLSPGLGTWTALVHRLCEMGRAEESEGVVRCMVRLGETPPRTMYDDVIRRYRAENDTVKVSEMVKMMQESGYEPDFDTHWSLISNLSSSREKKTMSHNGRGFLSRLLSGNGFT